MKRLLIACALVTVALASSAGIQQLLGRASPVTWSATGTAGNNVDFIGYSDGDAYGSLTPVTTSDGKTVTDLYTDSMSGATTFKVSGFSADPGDYWLRQLTVNGHAYTPGSRSYSGGVSTWTWPGNEGALIDGNPITASIP